MATASSAKADVGTIKVAIGDVKVVGVDGVARSVGVGDKVYAGESVQTGPNAVVQVQLANGKMLDLGRESAISLTPELLAASAAESPAVAATPVVDPAKATEDAAKKARIAELEKRLQSGDISVIDELNTLQSTAAGPSQAPGAGGAEGNEGHEAVVVGQANSRGVVTAGYQTNPIGLGFEQPLPYTQLPPLPSVSVAVQVEVQVAIDQPKARNDFDVVVGNKATGNVISGAETITGKSGADNVGSEGATVTAVTGTPISSSDGVIVVHGQYGTLVLSQNGTYEYTRDPGAPDNVLETFTYTLTDGSGDTSKANLVIDVGGNNPENPDNPPNSDPNNDVPVARTDTDFIPVGGKTATGNVITTVGTTSGATGVDTVGTEGAQVTGVSGTPVSNVAGVITVLGQYGTLVINPDGNYVYTRDPNAPDGVSETFTYTLTDASGDSSKADLVIDVGSKPQDPPPPDEPPNYDDVVISGNAASLVEGTGGPDRVVNFVISLDRVYVSDVTVTYTIVPGSAQSPADFGGVLTASVTIPAGQISFVVPVSIVPDHLVESDEGFRIVLSNAINATINPNADRAFVTIIDDDLPPTARDDTYSVSRLQPNDLPSVLTKKDPGEIDDDGGDGPGETLLVVNPDGTPLPPQGLTITTTKGGTVVIQPDGTFTYTAPPGLQGSDSFKYTMTDAVNGQPIGNGTSTATVTLVPSNDPPKVSFDLAPGDASVNEAALAVGSNPNSPDEVKKGTFTISDPDGLGDLLSVTINGQTVPLSGLPGTVIDTPAGKMTIDSYDPNTGKVGFTYLLETPVQDIPGQPEQDIFTVTVTDKGGLTSAPATLPITIVDDLPTARDDTDSLAPGAFGPETGNVLTGVGTTSNGADTPGADTATVTGIAGKPGSTPVQNPDGSFTVSGVYGTLTILPNGEYSYVRDPGTPGGVQDVFNYVVTDGDSDTSPAKLTINIGDATPDLFLDSPTVDEAGLPQGSEAPLNSETTTGKITFSVTDGFGGITLNGVPVTGAPGQQITGANGTLTVTGLDPATGVLTYSYTLTTPTKGEGTTDPFTVVLKDGNGTPKDGVLTINIIDDEPNARNDTDAIPEGGVEAKGNVITGDGTTNDPDGDDVKGADNATVTNIASPNVPGSAPVTNPDGSLSIPGVYGTLTIQPNGDYAYTRNPNTPGGVTESFVYTLTDGDGDKDTATLLISIGDAPVTLEVPDSQVKESALAGIGSDPTSNEETTTGTITFVVKDGLQSVAIDGVTVTGANQNIPGDHGTLTITKYDPVNGVIDYRYTLTEATTEGVDSTDPFNVVVTDNNGSKAEAPLVIDIIDDVPLARNDSDTVNGFIPESGNVITADGTNTPQGPDTKGADDAKVTGIGSKGNPGSPVTTDVTTGQMTVEGQYGKLEINPDGSYTYTRNPGTPGNVADTFSYVLTDNDGDASRADLVINIGNTGGLLDVPAAEVREEGLPNGSKAADDSEIVAKSFTFKSLDGLESLTIKGVKITGVETITGDFGTLKITGFVYDKVSGEGKVDYEYTLTTNTSGDTTADKFDVKVTDLDGDISTGTLNVNIVDDVPVANDDTDSVAAGTFGPETGNVITGSGTTSGNAGADVKGADNATLTAIQGPNGTLAVPANGSVTIDGLYGQLTISPNGEYSYTRTPGTPGGVDDVFAYTLTDGDTDSDPATLTIRIGDSPVELRLDKIEVNEAGLPARAGEPQGSGEEKADPATKDSETNNGVITFNAKDGLKSVLIGGDAVDFGKGPNDPLQTINGANGTLTITGTTYDKLTGNGTVTYSYTLKDNTQGDTTTENFAVVVTEADGDSVDKTLTIDIINDAPEARDDTDKVAEGSFAPETGNVIDAAGTTNSPAGKDIRGADDVKLTAIESISVPGASSTVPAVGSTVINGQYGVLTIESDGDYSYQRNPGTPGGVVDVFRYTVTDSDGDSSPANLTISIGDAQIELDIPGRSVNEAGLGLPGVTGSDSLSNSETTKGTFTFAHKDALDAVTIDGVTVTGAGQNIPGDHGTLTITSFDPVAGVIDYTYTLTERTDGDNTRDIFDVVVKEQDGSEAKAPLTITIIDDKPSAQNDVDATESAPGQPDRATGNVITAVSTQGNAGADTPGADNVKLTAVTSLDTANVATKDPNTGVLTIQGKYGVLTIEPDGDYSYVRDAGTPGGVQEVFRYTLTDGDTINPDQAAANLTITIGNQVNSLFVPAATVFEEGLPARAGEPAGSKAADPSETTQGAFTFKSVDGLDSVTLDNVAVTVPVPGQPAQTFAGQFGTLTIDKFIYDPVTGEGKVEYTYTLADNADHLKVTLDDFAVKVTDKDGDFSTGTLNVNIEDDVPSITVTAAAPNLLQVDESDLSKDATVDFSDRFTTVQGADGATLVYDLDVKSPGVNSGVVDVASGNPVYLYEENDVVVGRVGNAAGADPAGSIAFTVSVDQSGKVTLDQVLALRHPDANNPDDEISLGAPDLITLQGTITDSDGDARDAALNLGDVISFKDDGPSLNKDYAPIEASVREDGMRLATADNSDGNQALADTSADETNSTLAGSLAPLVNPGADQPPTFGLKLDAGDLPSLLSNGNPVSYSVSDTNGDKVNDTLTATAGGKTVFTMTVNANGTWSFDLTDQLDHVAGAGENTALRTTAGSVDAIDFSKLIQVTDADGDAVEPLKNGDFKISIVDDIPTRSANLDYKVGGRVEEDGMSRTAAAVGTLGAGAPADNSEGNKAAAGDSNADDEVRGAAGELTRLFSAGADEEVTIGLTNDPAALAGLPKLLSNGQEVTYNVTGNVLTAYVESGVPGLDAADREVFTLTVNANGSWTFDLKDQLDHVAGDGENTALRTVGGTASNIDLSSVLTATDADGDTLKQGLNAGDFAITVEDDIPTRSANLDYKVGGRVEEDGMSRTAAAVGTLGAGAPADNSEGNKAAAGDSNADDEVRGAAGELTRLFSAGADEEVTIGLTNDPAALAALPRLLSNGQEVTYNVTGNVLTAYVDSGVAGTAGALDATDREVFTLTVNANGSWSFDLKDQLDHVAGDGENTALRTVGGTASNIDLSSVLTATDADGDTLKQGLNAGDFAITVEDDIPTRSANLDYKVGGRVEEDGMSRTAAAVGTLGAGAPADNSEGNKAAAGDSNADDEVRGAAGELTRLFSAGADEEVTIGLTNDPAALAGLPKLLSNGQEVTYNVTGNVLTAYVESGVPGLDAADREVFTLTVNANGSWTFDLKDQLDHVAGDGENTALRTVGGTASNIDLSSVLTATDADGDTLKQGLNAGDFAITVEDDIPTRSANLDYKVGGRVEEDGMSRTAAAVGTLGAGAPADNSEGNKAAAGDSNADDEVRGAAGELTRLFSAGADEEVTIGLTNDPAALAALPRLLSNGQEVTYNVTGNVLTAYVESGVPGLDAADREVFTLTVNANGSWTFDLKDQLDHVAGGDENSALRTVGGGTASNIDLSSVLTATDADGDTLKQGLSAGDFAITVQDDIPTRSANLDYKVSGAVEEDGMSRATGDNSEGNKQPGDTNADDETAGAPGSLTRLFSAGADEEVTIGLNNDPAALAGLPKLLSNGQEVTYNVTGNVLTAYVESGVPGLDAADREVFTLTVNANGSWTFDLKDQLDHVAGDGENTALRTVGGTASNIDLSSVLTATDADGDTLKQGLNAGDFAITVEDDIPTRSANLDYKVGGRVEEDGMSRTAAAVGTLGAGAPADNSEGNKAAAGDSNADDEVRGAAGELTRLFSAGADEEVTIGLTNDPAALAALPRLLSNGQEVTYNVTGNVLTAYVDSGVAGTAGALDATDREVFTLTVNANGSWSFDLKDQLDHVAGDGENTALRTVGGTASNIDLSSVLTATDADGDTLKQGLNAGDFAITVEDDIPTRSANLDYKVGGRVEEDGMSRTAAAVGTLGAGAPADNSEGNKAAAGDSNADDEVRGAAGELTRLFSAGADEEVTIGLTNDPAALAALPRLLSNGQEVTYNVTGNVLTAYVESGVAGTAGALDATDREVFTLTVNANGSWSFDLKDQLDHVAGDGENTALRTVGGTASNIDLSSVLTATDADGDTLKQGLNAGDFAITVEDDIPTRSANLDYKVGGRVEEDGMSRTAAAVGTLGAGAPADNSEGNKAAAGDSNADDEVRGAAGELTRLFSAGADEEVTIGLTNDPAALAALPRLLSNGQEVTYNVTGNVLTAYVDSGVAGTAGALDATDREVFTLTVNANGSWSFDLKDQLDHVAGDGENTALRTVGGTASNIDLSSVLTATDADGDTLKQGLNAGDFAITVEDDIPVLTPATITGAVEEEALAGGNPDANDFTNINADGDGNNAQATGSLSSLVTVGADETGVFSLDAAAINTLTAQGLKSGGVDLTYSVSGDTLTAKAGAADVFTLTLSGADKSNYTFTLLKAIDHPTVSVEDVKDINFGGVVKFTDKDGDSVNLGANAFTIKVQDDIPIAGDSSKIASVEPVITNLTLVLDVSGSMGAASGIAGLTRLDAEKQAAIRLIDEYANRGDVKVTLVTFSTTAATQGIWLDAAAAKAVINGPTFPGAAGWTNYDDALAAAKAGYGAANRAGLLPNAKDVLYFLSDGNPTAGSGQDGPGKETNASAPNGGAGAGIGPDEQIAWQNFLAGSTSAGNAAGEKITAYALGMGAGVGAAGLNPVAYDGVTGTDPAGNTILVTDFAQLSNALLATVDQPPVTGNLLTDSTPDASYGADGAGYLQQVIVDGKVYTFDGTNNAQTLPVGVPAADAQYNTTTHQWTIKTDANGGKIVVDMDDGTYTYTPPNQLASSQNETVGFTIRDRDGDTATGNLTINIEAPRLVVGENVNDGQAGVTTAHKVDPVAGTAGVIAGQSSYDVLVGDVGGGTLQNKSTNVVLVLDTSGSMGNTFGGGSTSRLQALKDGVSAMLDNLSNSGAVNVRVHINHFSDTVASGDAGAQTFDLIVNGVKNATALTNAKGFVNGFTASGFTNYEAGLQEALTWIGNGSSDANNNELTAASTGTEVVNQAVFVSDGQPNRSLGTSTNGNDTSLSSVINYADNPTGWNEALQQVLGTDATAPTDNVNEAALIESRFGRLDAIGISLPDGTGGTDNALGRLTQLEGAANSTGGNDGATNTSNPAGFTQALQSVSPNNSLAGVGNDLINGGAGADIIFGDALNTDTLGAAKGLNLPAGSGWQVFQTLEAGTSGWTRADTLEYIRTHQAELGAESVGSGGVRRSGGNDTINAGDGADVVYGQEGNDFISGGAGNDILVGGSGADTFKWGASDKGTAASPATDIIRDFNPTNAAAEKDVLDLRDLLQGESSGTLANYLSFQQTGSDVTLSIKSAGSGTADQVITLQGVTMQQLAGVGPAAAASSSDVINNLLANNKLITD